MGGHKVEESGIKVGGRDLSVIVLYSLVLIMFVIAFVEIFVLVHLEVYFHIYSGLYSMNIILLYNS